MINPTPEVRTALQSLSQNRSAFKTVTEWMQGSLHKSACDLIGARGDDVPRLQRECQVWTQLLNFFDRVDEDDVSRLLPQLDDEFRPNTGPRESGADSAT